jgi:integrative and conjugative element protein (TIGR02256 family)
MATVGVGRRANRGFARYIPAQSEHENIDLERSVKRKVSSDSDLFHFAEAFFPGPDSPRREPFYPEPGCSDSTFVGSAADMSALAGTMFNWIAKKIREGEHTAKAFLCSQQHLDLPSGASHLEIESDAYYVKSDGRNNYEVRLRDGVKEDILQYIEDAKERNGSEAETGGPVFGIWDDARKIFWIDVADPAPPDSVERPGRFTCGTEGLQDRNHQLLEESGGATGFMGTWHTHPQSPPVPSEHDNTSMSDFFSRPEELPRRFLMVIVGNLEDSPTLHPHVFKEVEFDSGLDNV